MQNFVILVLQTFICDVRRAFAAHFNKKFVEVVIC
jgi:hypothetical protein